MASTGNLLLELFAIFAGGKLLAELAERLRQPSVVGEILAGVLLGPSLLGLVHPNVAKLRSQNARLFSPSFSASVCRWRRSILEWPRSSELSWLAWPWLPTASRGACERMRIPSWYSSRRSFCAAGCSGVPKDNGTIQCSFHGIGHLSAGSFEQAD